MVVLFEWFVAPMISVASHALRLEKCAWMEQQCLGKELVEVCSAAPALGLLGSLGALLALIM